MRALLYACTTAADLGRTVLDEKLPELRRYCAVKGWIVAGEFTDSIPTGVGRRPGFAELVAAGQAGIGEVVVANSIADLCWDLGTGLARLREMGVGSGMWLVCVRNSFDATTPAGALRLLDAMGLVAEHRRDRARDRQQIGILRSRARESGVSMAGRPQVVLSLLELREMYESGLSQSEMLRKLTAAGAPVSKGKLSSAIKTALEAGSLDLDRRAGALAARGGVPRGGPRPGGDIELSAFAASYEAGKSIREIVRDLRAEGRKVSRQWLTKVIGAAVAAGKLSTAARESAIAEARERLAYRRRHRTRAA